MNSACLLHKKLPTDCVRIVSGTTAISKLQVILNLKDNRTPDPPNIHQSFSSNATEMITNPFTKDACAAGRDIEVRNTFTGDACAVEKNYELNIPSTSDEFAIGRKFRPVFAWTGYPTAPPSPTHPGRFSKRQGLVDDEAENVKDESDASVQYDGTVMAWEHHY